MDLWIKEFIEQFGYWGVFLLIALENIFPPIPSEVILTFGGYMTSQTNLNIVGVIAASTIGSVFGAVILYQIGAIFNVKKLEVVIERYGRFLRLTKEDLYRTDAWFDKYGIWTVFLSFYSTYSQSNFNPCRYGENEFLAFHQFYNHGHDYLEYSLDQSWGRGWRKLGSYRGKNGPIF